jgi:hypothetical protein
MFSVEFTIGRRSVPPKVQSEETGRSEFCGATEARLPFSAARSGMKPISKEAGRDQYAHNRQPFFSRLLSGRWCRG